MRQTAYKVNHPKTAHLKLWYSKHELWHSQGISTKMLFFSMLVAVDTYIRIGIREPERKQNLFKRTYCNDK